MPVVAVEAAVVVVTATVESVGGTNVAVGSIGTLVASEDVVVEESFGAEVQDAITNMTDAATTTC